MTTDNKPKAFLIRVRETFYPGQPLNVLKAEVAKLTDKDRFDLTEAFNREGMAVTPPALAVA